MGIVISSELPFFNWPKGWIEIIDVLAKQVPAFNDTRVAELGCTPSPCGCISICPGGTFWTASNFRIDEGKGGAIFVSGATSIALIETTFADNRGGGNRGGNVVFIEEAEDFYVSQSTVDEQVNALAMQSVTNWDCASFPCKTDMFAQPG